MNVTQPEVDRLIQRLFNVTGKHYPALYKMLMHLPLNQWSREIVLDAERFIRDVEDEKQMSEKKGNRQAQMGRFR